MGDERGRVRRSLWCLVLGFGLASALATRGVADDDNVHFGPHDVHSAFHVRKSQNHNQVHYGVRLDAECRPVGERPVFAYWQRLERGPGIVAPLVGAGTRVYGASEKQTVMRSERGGAVTMFVKALESVRVHIALTQTPDGECVARATTRIDGQPAELEYAFVQLRVWNMGVKYVDLVGQRLTDGATLKQRVDN